MEGPALITGCSSGIGRATAIRMLERGWVVYATARRLDSIADLVGRGARTLAVDVTDEASMSAAVGAVVAEHGAIGVLVNNAGYGLQGPVEELGMDDVRAQFETNVFGLLRMTQLVLPGMRRRGSGCIVNVSSMGGRLVLPGGGAYHASKYAVEALSDALRFEVAGFGIGVSLVEPGPVLTPWVDTAVASMGDVAAAGPYAAFRSALATKVAGAYTGRNRLAASSPERVAEVIERAASTSRPKPRYVVGPAAHVLTLTRRLAPDAVFDAVLGAQFPRPRP